MYDTALHFETSKIHSRLIGKYPLVAHVVGTGGALYLLEERKGGFLRNANQQELHFQEIDVWQKISDSGRQARRRGRQLANVQEWTVIVRTLPVR